MTEIRILSIPISGYNSTTVPNRFFQQTGAARTLAVVLPGLNYTCDMPLLYYPSRLLVEHGADVLQVQADYTLRPSSPGSASNRWPAGAGRPGGGPSWHEAARLRAPDPDRQIHRHVGLAYLVTRAVMPPRPPSG